MLPPFGEDEPEDEVILAGVDAEKRHAPMKGDARLLRQYLRRPTRRHRLRQRIEQRAQLRRSFRKVPIEIAEDGAGMRLIEIRERALAVRTYPHRITHARNRSAGGL